MMCSIDCKLHATRYVHLRKRAGEEGQRSRNGGGQVEEDGWRRSGGGGKE